MSRTDSEFWRRARRARDKLAAQFLNHPEVTLIDIGYIYEGDRRTDQIALRVHVRERWTKAGLKERVTFPEQIEDIPVVVMPGEYRLEKSNQTPDKGRS